MQQAILTISGVVHVPQGKLGMLPGPAGLLQVALQAGDLPSNLSDLPTSVLGRKACCFASQSDSSFLKPLWHTAARSVGLDPAFKGLQAPFVTAGAVSSLAGRSARRMLLVLQGLHITACGDACVTLRVRIVALYMLTACV